VTHTIDENGYITEFDITQSAESSLLGFIRKKTDAEVTSPRDRTEKYYGVYIAKVLQPPTVASDPDPASALGARVKVTFPWLSDLNESGWARVASPSSGMNSGMYFMPNTGDTVIVAFQDGNISMPIVLGSVWDGPTRPPVPAPTPFNTVQMIKTRLGHTITLDDTPGNQSVTVTHFNKTTSITLGNDGSITVNAVNNLNLNSTSTISLQAPTIALQATNVNVTVTGAMNVT
jgi:uncharacterized protein involved in type VI secretion and phage assembly